MPTAALIALAAIALVVLGLVLRHGRKEDPPGALPPPRFAFRLPAAAAAVLLGAVLLLAAWLTREYVARLPVRQIAAPRRTGFHGIGRSLLLGHVRDDGREERTCRLAHGVLTMTIRERSGGYATCCVENDPPVPVGAGYALSAQVELQRPEGEFHILAETASGLLIFLYKAGLGEGHFSHRIPLVRKDFGGQASALLARFCIAAVGPGEPQTIHVKDARVTLPGTVQ